MGFDVNIAGSAIGHPGSYTGTYGKGGSKAVPDLNAYHEDNTDGDPNNDTFLTEGSHFGNE